MHHQEHHVVLSVVCYMIWKCLSYLTTGEEVWVMWKGQWYAATVRAVGHSVFPLDEITPVPKYQVHYKTFGKR